jgi:hypothetical protein
VNLEKEIDKLYGAPGEEFVARRKALAQKLRKEGERASAMRVEDLRRPTAAAAVVNRLVREERMNVRALLAAGDRLRQAQAELLRGGSAEAVHKATADERKALSALLAAARQRGAGDAVLRKVEQTLRAVAVDEEARGLFEQGRLTKELEPVGFGFMPEQAPRRRRSKK